MGLSTLAQDDRLNAPSMGVSKIMNTKDHKVVYQSGMLGGVYGASNGLIKLKDNDEPSLVLNDGQETTLNVGLASGMSNGNSGLKYGGGLGISYVGEEADGQQNFMPIHSLSFKQQLDAKESDMPSYLYSNFNCTYPPKLGQSCPLTVAIGGLNDGKRHQGHLYIADTASKTTVVPVYVNVHLMLDSNNNTVSTQSVDPTFSINVNNLGSQGYSALNISGIPASATITANTCVADATTHLIPNKCSITYDASQVDAGSYPLMVSGVFSGQQPTTATLDADQEAFTLNVTN